MISHLCINPDYFKGYLIRAGDRNIGEQFFDTVEDAQKYLDYINFSLESIGEKPFEDCLIEYKDYSNQIGVDLLKELRKFL